MTEQPAHAASRPRKTRRSPDTVFHAKACAAVADRVAQIAKSWTMAEVQPEVGDDVAGDGRGIHERSGSDVVEHTDGTRDRRHVVGSGRIEIGSRSTSPETDFASISGMRRPRPHVARDRLQLETRRRCLWLRRRRKRSSRPPGADPLNVRPTRPSSPSHTAEPRRDHGSRPVVISMTHQVGP